MTREGRRSTGSLGISVQVHPLNFRQQKSGKSVLKAFVIRDADNGMRAFWRTRLLVLVCVTMRECVYPSAANSQSTRSRESPTADGWRHSAGCYRYLRTSVAIYGRLSAATDCKTWSDSRRAFSKNRCEKIRSAICSRYNAILNSPDWATTIHPRSSALAR